MPSFPKPTDFDKQWVRKSIKAHKAQETKRRRMEAALAATVAKLQAAIAIQECIEYELGRTRTAAECNFERQYGEAAWLALVSKKK